MTKLLSMNRRNFLQASAAGALAGAMPGLIASSAAAQTALTVGFIYVGPKDDYGYNQAHAEGAAALKGMRGRHRRRGGERAGDRRRPEDDGIDDQSRRRDAALPDLLRLFRPAHAGHGREISRTCSSAIAAACGQRASTRRIPAPISAISAWASI